MKRVAVLLWFTALIPFEIFAQYDPVDLNSEAYHIARGGRLYDKWFKESEAAHRPDQANPAYPQQSHYHADRKHGDWRCKECHGWDYKGRDGIYRSGKHATGIVGINRVLGRSSGQIERILSDSTHDLKRWMPQQDIKDLALFVSKGQFDVAHYIDADGVVVMGDATRGVGYYQTICANCHGLDGAAEDTAPPLGGLSRKNPWEVLHKILNGQPNAEMPALRALDKQIPVDILAYLQTLK